jgi:hypothetical protein
VDWFRDELVPRIRVSAAGSRHRSEEGVEKDQCAGHLPPTEVPAAAERQLWVDSRVPAPAIVSATSRSVSAATPDSASAYSNVKPA